MPLADVQRRLRDAVVNAQTHRAVSLLVGGLDPKGRLAIHQRHYEASLVSALLSRFAATAWLVGSPSLIDAARSFVRAHPPSAPCIAEYGGGFPAWLARDPIGERVPFLEDFATLDWHLGRVSVEVDRSGVAAEDLSQLRPEAVMEATVEFQTGVHYLTSAWPIDEVMTMYLTETEPGTEPLEPTKARLEVRGARGVFQFTRLDEPEFRFRRAVHRGDTLGAAATEALETDGAFDAGRALAALFASGLPFRVTPAGDRPYN